MEIKDAPGGFIDNELNMELMKDTDYQATILDVKTTPGVLEAIQELPEHPIPMLRLLYILKVEPDLQDSILQQLLPHPGIKSIEKISARYLGDFKYSPD